MPCIKHQSAGQYTPTAIAASGIVPAHCGPPTAPEGLRAILSKTVLRLYTVGYAQSECPPCAPASVGHSTSARIPAPAAKPAKQNACAASEHTVNNTATSNSAAAAGNTEGTESEGRSGHPLPEAGVRSWRHTARAKAKEGTPAQSMVHVRCRLGRAPCFGSLLIERG
jgi:hypothetical protein